VISIRRAYLARRIYFALDGQDLRDHPFLDCKAALARMLRDTETGILVNEHVAEDGPTVFAHACRLGAEGIVSKRVDGTYRSGPCPVWNQGSESRQHRGAAGARREVEVSSISALMFGL
jgi:hypothetical protein